jgi:hypothetical protein
MGIAWMVGFGEVGLRFRIYNSTSIFGSSHLRNKIIGSICVNPSSCIKASVVPARALGETRSITVSRRCYENNRASYVSTPVQTKREVASLFFSELPSILVGKPLVHQRKDSYWSSTGTFKGISWAAVVY